MYNGRARLTDLEFAHQYGNGIKEYDHTRTVSLIKARNITELNQ